MYYCNRRLGFFTWLFSGLSVHHEDLPAPSFGIFRNFWWRERLCLMEFWNCSNHYEFLDHFSTWSYLPSSRARGVCPLSEVWHGPHHPVIDLAQCQPSVWGTLYSLHNTKYMWRPGHSDQLSSPLWSSLRRKSYPRGCAEHLSLTCSFLEVRRGTSLRYKTNWF